MAIASRNGNSSRAVMKKGEGPEEGRWWWGGRTSLRDSGNKGDDECVWAASPVKGSERVRRGGGGDEGGRI